MGDEVQLGRRQDPPVQGEIFPPAPIQCSNVLQIEYKPEEYEVPVRKCEQGQAKKCFEYKVPKWEVVRILADGTIGHQ